MTLNEHDISPTFFFLKEKANQETLAGQPSQIWLGDWQTVANYGACQVRKSQEYFCMAVLYLPGQICLFLAPPLGTCINNHGLISCYADACWINNLLIVNDEHTWHVTKPHSKSFIHRIKNRKEMIKIHFNTVLCIKKIFCITC